MFAFYYFFPKQINIPRQCFELQVEAVAVASEMKYLS